MKESEIITKYNELKERAGAVGISLKTVANDQLGFLDIPGSNGIVGFENTHDLEIFIRGYELGYKAGL